MAAALLFWGWYTGFLAGAAVIAVALEASRLVRWRWALSRRDDLRLRRLCALVLTLMTVYCLATVELLRAFLITLSLYPLAVLPIMLARAYGARGHVGTGMLFFFSGTRPAEAPERPLLDLPPCYPYLTLLVLAASAANVRGPGFYAGGCLLAAWALWGARRRRSSPILWAVGVLLATTLGFLGHVGLQGLQGQIETALVRWMTDGGGDTDPARSHTAIGRIGTLKLSDAILFRVEVPAGEPASLLLREASYTRYASTVWSASEPHFAPLAADADTQGWTLAPGASHRRLTVLFPFPEGPMVLPLPAGATWVGGLPAERLGRNRLGTIQAQTRRGLAAYQIRFDPRPVAAAPPGAADHLIPPPEQPTLARITDELGLAGLPPEDALRVLTEFFRARFRYSLTQPELPRGISPLQAFLTRTRSGHCEHFATATALLLRQAGVPARYVTGYLVHEFSRLEQRYLVRARHAHAWVEAYVDGAWRTLDTTPPAWMEIEAEGASLWTPIADLWSWGTFQVAWLWHWVREASRAGLLLWLLIPLGGFLAWRWRRTGRSLRLVKQPQGSQPVSPPPGADSEFYLVAERMEALGLGRRPWEPIGGWLARIDGHPALPVDREALRAAAGLHARYRFDPQGLSPTERDRLEASARALLAQVEAASASAQPTR